MIFSNEYFTGDFGSVTTIGRIKVFGWDVSAADAPAALPRRVPRRLRRRRARWSRTSVAPAPGDASSRCATTSAPRRRSGISVFGAKLYAFSVGAAIASFAGILLAFKDSTVVYGRYDPFQSINTVGNAVAGGVGWVLGAVFGGNLAPGGVGSIALDWIDLGSWLVTIGGVTLIVIVILNPNGIASVVLNDERGIGKLRLRLRRKPAREELRRRRRRARWRRRRSRSNDLTVRFGAVVAVDDVSFRVAPGEVVGLIGPNGAGKTTIVDAVTGFTKPTAGRVRAQRHADGRPAVGSGAPRHAPGSDARSSRSSCSRTSRSRRTSTPAPGSARALPGCATCSGPARPVLPPTAVSSVREFGLEQRPRSSAGRAALRAAPARRHRPGGRVGAVGAAARRARRRARRDETAELGDLVRRLRRRLGHGRAAHRARRGPRARRLRPDRRARLRAQDRRGHARRDPQRPAVIAAYLGEDAPDADTEPVAVGEPSSWRRRSRRRDRADGPLLECRGLAAGYGAVAVVRDLDLHVEPGEVVALHRTERRGQDDDAADARRRAPPIAGRGACSAARDQGAAAPAGARRAWASSPRSGRCSCSSPPRRTSASPASRRPTRSSCSPSSSR